MLQRVLPTSIFWRSSESWQEPGFPPWKTHKAAWEKFHEGHRTALIRIGFLPCLFQYQSHIIPAFIYDAFDHKYQHYFSHFTQTSYFVALRALKRCPSPSPSKSITSTHATLKNKSIIFITHATRFNEMKNQLLSHCSFKYNRIYPSPDYYSFCLFKKALNNKEDFSLPNSNLEDKSEVLFQYG